MAIGVALSGSIAAVAIPSFLREVHASRLVEPTEGLSRLDAAALAYAEAQGRFPDSAPLTPAVVPRGKKEVDPPLAWEHPTWRALAFRAAPEGVPHAYCFEFERNGQAFIARARGDLDGDGILSLFEVRGAIRPGDKPTLDPGMYVEAELE
jgi:hypothetical protein